jgi:methylthioribulose-1-phosphate dehydratase
MAQVIPLGEGDAAASGEAEAMAVRSVIEAGRRAAERRWVPSTSGNLSVRIDAGRIAITRSGTDKGNLTPADVLIADLDRPDPSASAEAPLHYALYRDHADIGAVLHVHSPASTVLSRLAEERGEVRLTGWELQKALSGVRSHEEEVVVPLLANDQDTVRLAETARRAFAAVDGKAAPGYLIAGHGLYAWGATPSIAWRHLEALETLLSYQLDYERLQP